MKTVRMFALASFCLFSSLLYGNNSIGSEASHTAGGFAIGGIATAIADTYYPEDRENRAWVGFWSNALIMAADFGIEISRDDSDLSGELMDLGFGVLGGALGAYTADRYLLQPVTAKAPDGTRSYGMRISHSF